MVEMRMLTDAAKQERFDFVWMVDGCKVPIFAQQDCEHALRLALTAALRMHGALDFGLGRV